MFYSLKTKVLIITAVIFLLLAFAVSRGSILGTQTIDKNALLSISPSPTIIASDFHKVIRVVDGDTVVVDISGKAETLRLIGIDTPEVVDPRKPVQCFGIQASNKAKEILNGKSIRLEDDKSQGDRDKYNRFLRYVFLEDGTNFNLMMIAQGYAHEYTYNLPYKYQSQFKLAEKQAMEKGLGLWGAGTCSGNTNTSPASSVSASTTPSSSSSLQKDTYKPTGQYACDCSKLCGQIKTCDEAYYQLQNCSCTARDSDGDGVPCETLCR